MNTKSVFVALSVIAVLALGSGLTAQAKPNQTDKKPIATKVANKPEAAKEPAPTPAVVTVVVKAGDTLEAIAAEHETTYVRLFDANPTITSPDLIDVGDEITIPAKDAELPDRFSQYVPAPQAATAVASTATSYTTQQYSSAPVNSNSYYVGNGMWCTDYVHAKRPDVAIYGNAGYNWIGAAQANGKSTGTTAKQGAVAVMDGHVAYVDSVNADGSYVVSEMGWNYKAGQYNQRTVQPGAFGGFIY